jgi:hypothetical protein
MAQMPSTPVLPSVVPPVVFDEAERFRTELMLTEQQKLVESLSRLQFEMQNLDLQLSREASAKNFESAFEPPPKVETESLQRISAEFRKACEEANQAESRAGSILPPLEHLTSLIPQIFNEAQEAFAPASAVATPAAAVAGAVVTPAPTVPAPLAAVVSSEPGQDSAVDPVLRREMAQAKVRAALDRARQPATAAAAQPKDLEAARAMAKEINKPAEPVIRKVLFPRIEKP